MSKRNSKQGRPMRSHHVWIRPVPNEEIDARKLSRAYLALALHQAAEEAAAQEEHAAGTTTGDSDETA